MKKIIEIDTDLVRVVPRKENPEWRERLSEIGYSHETVIADVLDAVPADLPGVVEHSGEPVAYALLDQGCRAPDDCEDFERLAYAGELTPPELHKFESAGRATPLFTHPPAQPDTEALNARIAEMLAIEKREMEVVAAERVIARTRIAELEARIAGLERNVHQATVNVIQSQIAAQAAQEPIAWVRRHPGGALTAEFIEDAVIEPVRKRSGAWVALYAASPEPSNILAIVQAALEAATHCCPGGSYCDPQQIADAIRAIAPQTIINAATKGQQ